MDQVQAMFDGLSAAWQKERAAEQMTLGSLITALRELPNGTEVQKFDGIGSYRGYYCDIALEPGSGMMPVADLLALCESAMGRVYEGYKGGDFLMGESTPIWIAEYGCLGEKIMTVNDDGTFVTLTDD